MTKFKEIDKLLEQNDGYLFSKDVEKAGISRTYLVSYVKERGLENVSIGKSSIQATFVYFFL